MPLLNFSKTPKVTGDGWTEAGLQQARKLVLNADTDIDPSAMPHAQFCEWWADYRLKQMQGESI